MRSRPPRWKVRAIVVGVVAIVVLPIMAGAVYVRVQSRNAKAAEEFVRGALTGEDASAKAKEIRSLVVDDIGEFELIELVSYPNLAPGYTYVDGTALAGDETYTFRFLYRRDRPGYSGAIQVENEDSTHAEERETR